MAANATAQTAPAARVWQGADLAGRYQLQGVREVGAELRLQSDNRFEFGMAYGGVDQTVRGRWVVRGRSVALSADEVPATGFKLNQTSTRLPDVYAADSRRPTLLVVSVKTPSLGLTWSNMAVVAEFSNGQSRAGITGRNGMLGFLVRTEPEWRGAYVQRISVAYPTAKVGATFFSIEMRSARFVEVDFEPGPLAPPAFTRAAFDVRDSVSGLTLVQQSPEGPGDAGWTFVKH